MKVIPDLMIHRIKRESEYEAPAEKHSSVVENERMQEALKDNLLKLHNASTSLKNSNPDAWKIYEESLLSMYVEAKELQDRDFFELLAEGRDPSYFTYIKINAQAKIEVLQSILSISLVPIENLNKIEKPKKLLDKIRKWVIG